MNGKLTAMTIKQRKKDHVALTASGEMEYIKNTGFDALHFRHNALPETDFDEVSTEQVFLDRRYPFPLFISCMTGGYTEAGSVNAILAEFCNDHNLPLGVGSQRIMLEDEDAIKTFSVVREKAPHAFITSNIGGAQLIGGLSKEKLNLLIDSIEADAVTVHLNPLQELMQPEGDRNFEGIELGIEQLVKESPVPVIVKETGAGISGEVARRLLDIGVSVIDLAGAGGTSWAKVENQRPSNTNPDSLFDEWGLPTLVCLQEVSRLKTQHTFELVASGGIRSGVDIAKALCLDADFTASAQPVIKAVAEGGREGLETLYNNWVRQLKTVMTLIGVEQLSDLKKDHLLIGGS